ncbi:MAG: 23S rRNA (guanosine(2251)-2'-O)-methyltransferase RlmB [Coriobacteriia bacterium]|nr:23S rRNA (guanosine(2251)-2'-O)-methyltransferase RlmB [Coriobacteriia bacterium]
MADRVEGRHAVEELLRSGRRVRSLRVLDTPGKDGAPLDRITRLAVDAGVPVERVGRGELDRDSERGAHQGVIAVVEAFRYTPLEAMLRDTAGNASSLVLALDHVTDPGNLGAVVRTADVVGAAGVIVAKDRAAEMTASAYKAAAGAAENVAVAREPNLVRALEQCKDAGFWVAGASEHADTLAWDAPLEGRLVLVFGSEGTGLSRLVERTCDLLVRLPTVGSVGSLNVSNAAAVLAFEWLRRQRS